MRYEDRSEHDTDTEERRGNGRRDSESIQQDIQRTRGDMHRTLEAIEAKLSPSELVGELISYFRGRRERSTEAGEGSAVGDAMGTVVQKIKDNPIPAAMIGIGIVGLATNRGPSSERLRGSGKAAKDRALQLKEGTSTSLRGARERGAKFAHGARETAASAASSAKSAAITAKDAASRVAGTASSAASKVGSSVGSGYHVVRDKVDEEPLLLGVMGLAIGAAIGLSAPRTRFEDETIGQRRDELFDRAREKGREIADDASEAAQATLGSAREEARSRGLDEDSMRESVRSAASGVREVARSAGESARGVVEKHKPKESDDRESTS